MNTDQTPSREFPGNVGNGCLERKGLIRRGKGDMLEWLEQRKLPKGRLKHSLVEAIIEERESGW